MCAGTGDCGTRRRNVYRRIDLRDRSPRYIPLKGRERKRVSEIEIERGNRRDRRVPGPRPASLPVTRRESRRPARKRPVGISIFLRPFPLPRRAAPRNTAPCRAGWSTSANAAFDSFVLVPRDRARAPERRRSNDRETLVETGFEVATLLAK